MLPISRKFDRTTLLYISNEENKRKEGGAHNKVAGYAIVA